MSDKENEYDKEPVYYCRRCLSLRILRVDSVDTIENNYCDKCGSVNIGKTTIEKWEEEKRRRK